jgi:hypothetical protein
MVYFIALDGDSSGKSLYDSLVEEYAEMTPGTPGMPSMPLYNMVSKVFIYGDFVIMGPVGIPDDIVTVTGDKIELGWSGRNTTDLRMIKVRSTGRLRVIFESI